MQAVSCVDCQIKPESPIFQGVSFHYYTHAGAGINSESATEFTEEQFYGTLAHAYGIERVISLHEAVMDSYDPERRVGLVCDEWGTWWNVEPGTNPGFLFQQNTIRDALVAGIHFDAFHRHAGRLTMANIAQTLNVLQAMILTDDDGGLVLTPTYHVFEMNKGHQGASHVPVNVIEGPTIEVGANHMPVVSLSASTSGERALISLTNASIDEDLDLRIHLRGMSASVERARVLSGESPAAHNTTATPSAVAPVALAVGLADDVLTVRLPAHSFATVELALGAASF